MFYNFRFSVTFILSKPPPEWGGLKGRISFETLEKFVCEESSITLGDGSLGGMPSIQSEESMLKGLDKLYAICGPDQFTNTIEQ